MSFWGDDYFIANTTNSNLDGYRITKKGSISDKRLSLFLRKRFVAAEGEDLEIVLRPVADGLKIPDGVTNVYTLKRRNQPVVNNSDRARGTPVELPMSAPNVIPDVVTGYSFGNSTVQEVDSYPSATTVESPGSDHVIDPSCNRVISSSPEEELLNDPTVVEASNWTDEDF